MVVQKVMKGSPADHAGLQRYDIVISYDAQDVYSPEQLVKARCGNDRPGREVSLAYVRGGSVKTTKLTLGEMPASAEVRSLRGGGNPRSGSHRQLERQTIARSANARVTRSLGPNSSRSLLPNSPTAGTRPRLTSTTKRRNGCIGSNRYAPK